MGVQGWALRRVTSHGSSHALRAVRGGDAGQWKHDEMSGNGEIQFTNGDKYEGDFKKGFRWGHGKFVAAAGWTYEGEWWRGIPHGTGELTAPNGAVWKGLFSLGRR